MAPGSKLPKDSPMGKDIQNIVREMLNKELSLTCSDNLNDTVTIQLMLGDQPVGNKLHLGITWEVDHGHGGGSYVTGLKATLWPK